jgi:hypothetical protein
LSAAVDLKPLEVPTEFFLSVAYNASRWGKDVISVYMELWATREFGSQNAKEIGELTQNYSVGLFSHVKCGNTVDAAILLVA